MGARHVFSRSHGGDVRTVAALILPLVLWSAAAVRSPEARIQAAPQQTAASAAPATLDYEFFRTRVQPIFLAKRPGHARCISCHSSGTPMRLQPLAAGSTSWTDDESHKNFEAARRMVVPGSLKSMLLIHPLEEQAGGDFFHSGGKHWRSQDDPEWQTLKAWLFCQTAN